MNTKVVSSAEPTLYFPHQKPTPPQKNINSTISFTSHVSKSISLKTPLTGSGRNRVTTRIRAFYAPAVETTETLYEVLGIKEPEMITFTEIKKAYKQMARKYHPDVSPPDRVDEYTRRFIMVHEAYETLSNPSTRASYDRDLSAGLLRYGSTNRYHNHQRVEETGEWKNQWESQLDELNRRSAVKNNSRGKMSWGARMRSQ